MSNLRLSMVMASMATLSTVMLGLGQNSFVLALLTFLAAVTSVLLTDWLAWFRLNRIVANLAMLLAAFFSLYGFLEAGSQQQLWAIANLLIYVQLVLLFQEKNRRVYGQLAMFSLLQVVVAALLSNGLEFGLLLGIYMVIAVVGFVLFFVYREVGRVGMVLPRRSWFEAPPEPPEELDAEVDGQGVIQVVQRGRALNNLIVAGRIRWPLLAMISATAVFTGVFFYTTPRTGGSNWDRGMAGHSVVGFSPEVTFDQMGQLLLDDRRVMRVSFTNARTGEAYTVIGEPYLRGAVLTNYVKGRWLQDVRSGQVAVPLESPPVVRDLVRQEVLLEPTGSNRLFSMFPLYRMATTGDELRIDPRTRHLYRSDVNSRDATYEYRYTVVTTAFNFGSQMSVIPHHNRLSNFAERARMVGDLETLLNIYSPERFPRLIALADEIVQQRAPAGNAYERARALESHFQEKGLYSYTLDMRYVNARRQQDLDPIEDFVANHRQGHCEYFASALTLMLRSQGIPARMVVGYRPDELNYVGNYFVVRQRHAHAWVEAYLKPDEIRDDMMYPQQRHAGGGWLRLDPTPVDETRQDSDADLLDRATNSFDYARWLWNDYVCRLTEERQRRALLDPLALDQSVSIARMVNAEGWSQWFRRLTGREEAEAGSRRQFPWRGIVALLVLVAGLYGGYWLIRRALPHVARLRHQWLTSAGLRRRVATVPFYQRLEATLARIGLQRAETQTQRQFAGLARQRLSQSPETAGLAEIPHRIVDAFYQVRFGQEVLGADQQAAIDQQLQQLEESLAN